MPYRLLDSGDGRKLEQFGELVLDRPRSGAVWHKSLPAGVWGKANGVFVREGGTQWSWKVQPPKEWRVSVDGLTFALRPTDFGHVGVFPEHVHGWRFVADALAGAKEQPNVLNLFAYSGGATLAAARAGARVCHLDAAKKMVDWARENAGLNGLSDAPIRWITDDVMKFLKREARRGARYEGIILDPPNFGRGTRMEVFKLEEQVWELLDAVRDVLAEKPLFVVLTCHAAGFTPMVLGHLLGQLLAGKRGQVEASEMVLAGEPGVLPLPVGSFAGWRRGAGES